MSQPNPWVVDSIAAGDRIFDSSRLRYASTRPCPSLAFEMVKIGEQIESFLSLARSHRSADELKKVFFTIGGDSFEEQIPIHEGGMRLRLSSETTQRLIQALQDGEKVAILLDDCEETLDPGRFAGSFAAFLGGARFFENLFKGPVQ